MLTPPQVTVYVALCVLPKHTLTHTHSSVSKRHAICICTYVYMLYLCVQGHLCMHTHESLELSRGCPELRHTLHPGWVLL